MRSDAREYEESPARMAMAEEGSDESATATWSNKLGNT